MGQIQLQVYDRFFRLTDLTKYIAVSNRTWVRNDFGTAQIEIPMNIPNAARMVQWGNILRVSEQGFPIWIGQATSREFVNGSAHLQCKSAEWMLSGKVTGQGKVYGATGNADAGSVAAALFQNAAVANSHLDVLHAGTFLHTAAVFREYSYTDLLEAYKKLATDTGADFWVDSSLRVHFTSRGKDQRASVVLREDKQLFNVRLVENIEDYYSAVIAMGNGSTVAEKPKVLLYRPDTEVFRAKVLDISGASTPEMLDTPARQFLISNSQPKLSVDADVLYPVGATWWVGDIITLVLVSHPVHSKVTVRVLGLERKSDNLLRGIFEIIPTVVDGFLPYTPV